MSSIGLGFLGLAFICHFALMSFCVQFENQPKLLCELLLRVGGKVESQQKLLHQSSVWWSSHCSEDESCWVRCNEKNKITLITWRSSTDTAGTV